MSARAVRCYEYSIECDHCEYLEVYHTNDEDNGVLVHSLASAIRAARFHKTGRKILCPLCWERHLENLKRRKNNGR
ncbi:MAG: hypothetical protein IKM73_08650 [Acidaminococcaceae bacterium]|nr:hypothetical protein [Acidaminococcaceae bacterium]